MTVSTSVSRSGPYAGAGTVGPFSVTFRFLDATHLLVVRADSAGVETILVLGTDYTVAGAGSDSGGSVTLTVALVVGTTLTIQRNVPITQLADYEQSDSFPAQSHEDALDKLTMIAQQQQLGINSALRVPETTSPLPAFPPIASRKNSIAGFDTLGNPVSLFTLPSGSFTTGQAFVDAFTGTGAQTVFTLSQNPGSQANLAVSVGGVVQRNGVDFTWGSGTTLTFTTAPPSTVPIQVRYSNALPITSVDSAAVTYANGVRSVQARLDETMSVKDKGAVGDGVADDAPAIIAAQAALVARGGGTLLYPAGTYRLISSSIPHANGITHQGAGKSTTDSNGASMGARIVSSVVDIFSNVGSINAGLTFRNLWLESQAGGGHIFAWSGSGLVAKVEIDGCLLFQKNAAKSVISGLAAGGVFSLWAHHFEYEYLVANSVPPINIVSFTVNSIDIEKFWSICSSGETSGTYSIWVESTNAAGAALGVTIEEGVFEVPGGGAVNLLSCRNSAIDNCGVFDLVTTPNNAMFRIAKGATGPASNDCSVRRVRSALGTALKPDLQLDLSVAGQSGFVVENCTLTWYDGVSASGNGAVHINNGISNFENAAYTELGGSTGNDLRWISQSASGKAYAIWNGVPGNGEGYLNIFQAGAYIGAISPAALLQWGGTRASPAFYVSQTGLLNTKTKIYPGNPAGVDQAVAGIYGGSGVPSNSDGSNGDFYLRGDTPGAANQRLYVKSAGAWVGVL